VNKDITAKKATIFHLQTDPNFPKIRIVMIGATIRDRRDQEGDPIHEALGEVCDQAAMNASVLADLFGLFD